MKNILMFIVAVIVMIATGIIVIVLFDYFEIPKFYTGLVVGILIRGMWDIYSNCWNE